MKGTLTLVSTPIGNLKDITLRALETLKEADVIACEDTRHSLALLNHYDIKKPLISYHEHNEVERSGEILKMLAEGKKVAVITDAGTPCVSDPGAKVVKKAREAGFNVTAAPGPSAVVTAVSLAGIESGFAFKGFLPEKKKDRTALFNAYKDIDIPIVFYASPHDVGGDIADISNAWGGREITVIRELTKVYETVLTGIAGQLDIGEPRGEYVLIVMPGKPEELPKDITPGALVVKLMGEGLDKKEAVKQAAKLLGLSRNEVYQQALEIKEDAGK